VPKRVRPSLEGRVKMLPSWRGRIRMLV